MVNYRTSAAALIAAAALASAQNVTIILGQNGNGTNVSPNNGNTNVSPNNGNSGTNINVGVDITFTQTFAQLCPTGLTDVEYVFTQHCPGGCPTATPYGVPNGWEVTTAACTVCGPSTSIVTITTCPYANATPVTQEACPTCYTDVVKYTPVPTCNTCPTGSATTVTNVYPPPTTSAPVALRTTSVCPGCPSATAASVPITVLSVATTSVCPGCPAATPVTLASVKSSGVVPTPVAYTSAAMPPAYTGAAAKREVGAGLMVAGALAVAALL